MNGYFLSGLGLGIHVQDVGFKVSVVAQDSVSCRPSKEQISVLIGILLVHELLLDLFGQVVP